MIVRIAGSFLCILFAASVSTRIDTRYQADHFTPSAKIVWKWGGCSSLATMLT